MTDMLSRPLAAEGLTPPQALEAERSVLAALMLDHEATGRAIEMLDPQAFYRTAHQKIYEAILAIYNRNDKSDLVTLSEELRKRGELEAIGGLPTLAQIVELATTSVNLEQHARLVNSKAILRQLIRASQEISQEAYAGSDETPSILDRAEQRIFAITDQRVRQGFAPIQELMMHSIKHIEDLAERNKGRAEHELLLTGVSSGYTDLDKLTAGFQRSDLIIIAGRPSMGKTSFALNIAENAATGKDKVPVAVFSLEMSKEQLVLRLLCSQAEVPLHKVRNGYLSDNELRKLMHLIGPLYSAPIMIDDSAAPTLMEIRAKCRRLRAERKLGLVIIDYLQLIRSSGNVENRVQEISQISRGLKALAKELDVPVIALSQLSRAVEQRGGSGRPQLSDLRESGCLTADTRVCRADTGALVTMCDLLASGERDIPVWTLDKDLRLVRGTMTHVFASGVKPVFELRLASGRMIKASSNHPFLTLDGWRRLDQLATGERLAVPRALPAPTRITHWEDAEIILLAHLIGDGCIVAGQPLHYTSADPENVRAVSEAASHFGVTARQVRQENWWHLYLTAPFRLTHGKRNPIVRWLDGLGLYGLRSFEKFVPEAVFSFDADSVALFLRHLWATDGCLHRGKARLPRIYYASTSRRLIDDVRALLLRLGIPSRVKTVQKGSYRVLYHLHVMGSTAQRAFLARVGAHGSKTTQAAAIEAFLGDVRENTNVDTIPVGVWQSVRIAMACRGVTTRQLASGLGTAYCGSTLYRHSPSRERLGRVATVLADEELSRLATSDLLWDAIVSITPIGEVPVFDATSCTTASSRTRTS
jgi:replicative DNA helicase